MVIEEGEEFKLPKYIGKRLLYIFLKAIRPIYPDMVAF